MSNHAQRRNYSRREFFIRSGLAGAGALSLPALIAACGGGSDGGSGGGGGGGGGAKTLYFENWPAYIDGATEADFEAATGIAMTYKEGYNDNNEYFAKVQTRLSSDKAIEADILAPTFWMASRYINLGWAQKLDKSKIPNVKNLRSDLRDPGFDPGNLYSMPWQTGTAGVAYNIDATGRELTSVADLFDPAFKGKIGMLTEMRDTIGLILLSEGVDPASITTFDDAAVAFEKLEKAKADGQIRQFTGNDYMDDLDTGNFAACVAWSGDVVQLSRDNPSVRYIIPEEGATSWYDTMIWMKGSEQSDSVAEWINYVYDPTNAAKIAAEVGYISPVEGVRDELVKMGGDAAMMAESTILFPTENEKKRLRTFASLSEEEEAKFDEAFAKITGA
jgi:spermidine/putrescine transport system substrate-binding protein